MSSHEGSSDDDNEPLMKAIEAAAFCRYLPR
jgi:hypothetical protein